MIVFACHNILSRVEYLVNTLKHIDLNNHKVLFIDTCSTNELFVKGFNVLKQNNPRFTFIRQETGTFDTGAYIYAYNNFLSDRYIFLQDSIEIIREDCFLHIDHLLDNYDVVTLFDGMFDLNYHHYQQTLDLDNDLLQKKGYPTHAIAGPNFFTHRTILDKIPKEWFFQPTTKYEAEDMERRWALMFHLLDVDKIEIMHKFRKEFFHEDYNSYTGDGTSYPYEVYIKKLLFASKRDLYENKISS